MAAAVANVYSGGLAQPLAKAFAALSISVSYVDKTTLLSTGHIEKYGGSGSAYLQLRMSNLKYMKKSCFLWWCSTCYYRVPVAMYFKVYR
jgi:hypothetical protein